MKTFIICIIIALSMGGAQAKNPERQRPGIAKPVRVKAPRKVKPTKSTIRCSSGKWRSAKAGCKPVR